MHHSTMRRAFTVLGVVIAVLAVADLGLRAMGDRIPDPVEWGSPYTQERAEALETIGNVDLAVLGSSVAGASIQADELTDGVGYNAALPGMAPRVWLPWFRDVVADADPETLVVTTDIRFFFDYDARASGELTSYLESPGRQREVAGPNLSDRVAEVWELYRLRSRLREPDRLLAALTGIGDLGDWRPVRVSEDGRHLGFAGATYDPQPGWLDTLAAEWRAGRLGGDEAAAIRTIVAEAVERDIDVVLVLTPAMWSELDDALPNGEADIATYEATVRAIGAEFDVPVLEFPQFDDRPAYYADYYHMNELGSDRFTAALDAALERMQRST